MKKACFVIPVFVFFACRDIPVDEGDLAEPLGPGAVSEADSVRLQTDRSTEVPAQTVRDSIIAPGKQNPQ